ncbi:hypothetical protein SARC_04085 [Sphaeroforma arctica JP610]|uniref:Protein kinase domain-containing protein n=1 Tax=Sphaeroforma arctica JP610 TaxID=667725 RepID=A0A0L0G3K3_9EUKA|nr:hypothetical protein SARC_04085 [Sphaeroforma arctica JP610]KNC83687.1 hypothetical protein SARC_04085 [Sphaeroforma arctica JP610]|eukprot:XP_014157589.1 hypothetical protein SARC_04085 [Sphaeroforma arctica JP610]
MRHRLWVVDRSDVVDDINPSNLTGTPLYFHPLVVTNLEQSKNPYDGEVNAYDVDVWAFAVLVLAIFSHGYAWESASLTDSGYRKFKSYTPNTPDTWVEDYRIVHMANLNHNVVAENMVYTALRILRTCESRCPLENRGTADLEAFSWRP